MMTLRVLGAAESRSAVVCWRLVPRFPAASATRAEGVGAVGGEVGCGSEGPAATFNGGIAEEGCTGIDAEGVSGAEVAVEGAREGGGEIVGASAIVEVSLMSPTLSEMRVMDAARDGSSGIKRSAGVCWRGAEVPSSISNARREGVGAVGGEVGLGVKDQLRSSTEALPRKDSRNRCGGFLRS